MFHHLPTNWFVRHLLFWAGIVLFFFIGFYTQPEVYTGDPIRFLTGLLFSSLISLLFYTYLLVYGLLPLAFKRSYGWFAVGLIGITIATSMLCDALNYVEHFFLLWIGHESSHFVNTIEFTNPFVHSVFVESNLVAGLFICLKLFSQWQQKKVESQQLEQEKLQTELQLLRLQIKPTFLFGSLNALHQLIQTQPKQAPEVVLNLAHFLRYILYESQADAVPLSRETEIIRHYVSLQQSMHPTGLDVSFTVRGNAAGRTIAPLSLFPIVAHAFRHLTNEPANESPTDDEPTWVSIDLAISETHLTLKVVDGQPGQPDDESWLADVRKQLHVYYPDQFDLRVLPEPDAHIVSLNLPAYCPIRAVGPPALHESASPSAG